MASTMWTHRAKSKRVPIMVRLPLAVRMVSSSPLPTPDYRPQCKIYHFSSLQPLDQFIHVDLRAHDGTPTTIHLFIHLQ